MNSEYVRRFIQMIMSNIIFDAPGLLQIRMWLYRLMFDVEKKTIFARNVMCIRPHNFQGEYLIIGRDAWIGAFAVILPDVRRIGEGAIIGTGSVVSRDVGDWEIVGGVPARVIGRRNE